MNVKVFFVVVGVLVVLVIAGAAVGLSGGTGGGEAAATPAWGDAVRRLLAQPLKASDIRTSFPPDCRNQLVQGSLAIPAGATCSFLVDSAKAQVRTVTLALAAGGEAEVQFDPLDDGRLTSKETLANAGDETEVDVFKAGGTLTVGCLGAAACQVSVKH